MLPRDASLAGRTIALGVLLAQYPLAQFLAAPAIGALSDRFGRKRTLLVSLAASTAACALIAAAVQARIFWLLAVLPLDAMAFLAVVAAALLSRRPTGSA